mmetsp:Transcript_28425/g.83065  ORF Transcript_28425/g.83065 Transcript_28425/m.83065 type:complete len:272 (-) Transcript_28425:201-1016(-)
MRTRKNGGLKGESPQRSMKALMTAPSRKSCSRVEPLSSGCPILLAPWETVTRGRHWKIARHKTRKRIKIESLASVGTPFGVFLERSTQTSLCTLTPCGNWEWSTQAISPRSGSRRKTCYESASRCCMAGRSSPPARLTRTCEAAYGTRMKKTWQESGNLVTPWLTLSSSASSSRPPPRHRQRVSRELPCAKARTRRGERSKGGLVLRRRATSTPLLPLSMIISWGGVDGCAAESHAPPPCCPLPMLTSTYMCTAVEVETPRHVIGGVVVCG